MRGKLTGNASGDDNNVGAGQGVLQAVVLGQVTREFLPTMLENKAARLTQESIADVTYSDGGDVREIGSNTRSVDNIVEGKLVNKRAGLQEERQGLANATRGTENSYFQRIWGQQRELFHQVEAGNAYQL